MWIDNTNRVLCNNGTYSIANGIAPPCVGAGGEKNETVQEKPVSEIVKQKNLLKMQNMNVLTAEDKFYEMLGIKKSNGGWGIQSRPIGRILVTVVLVAGYFAYKKFKK